MRILSLMCILLFGIVKANGQITLSAGDYPSVLTGVDSLKKTKYNSPFPSLSAGTDMIWDLSTIVDTTASYFAIRIPGITSHYEDSTQLTFAGYDYQNKTSTSILSSGIMEFNWMIDSSKYSLFTLTGSATDSIFIPAQTNLYTMPRKVIVFPGAYITTWNSQYTSDFHFELSIAGYSLTHAPAIRRTYTEESSTVTGYGKMRVKDATGGPSSYFSVLQVRTVTTSTDSFFLNGSPMSAALLGLFMLNQGHKDTIRVQNYYRKGEVTPLAKVEFRDDAFMQPYRATTHMQRLISVGVAQSEVRPISIFPNPTTNHISIELPFSANWHYHLTDITGRTIDEGNFTKPGIQTVELSSIPNGHYLLRISDGSTTAIQQIDVIK